ncbi:hypothetical protein ACOSQ4_022404 [Xanthoceras sorbifolium]
MLHNMNFDLVEFWVQIHNIPLLCMNKEVGIFLGKQIGEFIDIDLGDSGDCLGKYLRVRILINISKPLKRCIRIDLTGSGVETALLLRYERLPYHCFSCGMVGHSFCECPTVPFHASVAYQDFKFGSWLRAKSPEKKLSPLSRSMPQNSGDAAAVNRTFGPTYVVERPQPASPSPITREVAQSAELLSPIIDPPVDKTVPTISSVSAISGIHQLPSQIVQQQSNSQYSSLDNHCRPVILEEDVHNPRPNTYFDTSKPSIVYENSSLPISKSNFPQNRAQLSSQNGRDWPDLTSPLPLICILLPFWYKTATV